MRVCASFLLIYAARFLPSTTLKNFLYRICGARIGRRVTFGLGAMMDIFYPELIEIGDNTLIGYKSLILGHEFLQGEYRTGKVQIGKNVMIGANCTILPGVKIGDGASISAMTLVNCDIPSGQKWGGIPVARLRQAAIRPQRRGIRTTRRTLRARRLK